MITHTGMDEISSPISGRNAQEGIQGSDQSLLALRHCRDRLTQLEIRRASGELQLRNGITKDAEKYEKTIKNWKKEAIDWKRRFEEIWAVSQCQQRQSDTASDDSPIQMDAGSNLENKNSSAPHATGIDQANLLQDVLDKNKIGWKFGSGRKNSKGPSADEILLERYRVENEILRGELSKLQN